MPKAPGGRVVAENSPRQGPPRPRLFQIRPTHSETHVTAASRPRHLAATVAFALALALAAPALASAGTAYVANDDATTSPRSTPRPTPRGRRSGSARPQGIAITPDGADRLRRQLRTPTPSPRSTPPPTPPGTPIAVGAVPSAIAITPDGATAYVANVRRQRHPDRHRHEHRRHADRRRRASRTGSRSPPTARPPTSPTTAPTTSPRSTPRPTPPAPPIAVGDRPVRDRDHPRRRHRLRRQPRSRQRHPDRHRHQHRRHPDRRRHRPVGIAITPDGATAYVANLGADNVTPIDIATNTAGTPIAVGDSPCGIAITPDGATAYVTNAGADNVTPIDTATNTAGRRSGSATCPTRSRSPHRARSPAPLPASGHRDAGRRRDLRHGRRRPINGRGGDDTLLGDGGDDQLIGGPRSRRARRRRRSDDSANYTPGRTRRSRSISSTGRVADDGRGFAETVANVETVEGATNQVNTLTGDDAATSCSAACWPTAHRRRRRDLLRGEPERAASGDDDTLERRRGRRRAVPRPRPNTVDGGAGSDTLRYSGLGVAAGVVVDTSTGAEPRPGAVTDSFSAIENVTGTPTPTTSRSAGTASRASFGGATATTTLDQDGDNLDTMGGGAASTSVAPDRDTATNC